MLTPSKTDPNREKELKRRSSQPWTFESSQSEPVPKDWKPSGLVSADGKKIIRDPRGPKESKTTSKK